MPKPKTKIEEICEEFEKSFTDLYGLEDPTRTFRDHDDFLIIRDNFKSLLTQSLIEVAKSMVVEEKLPQRECHCNDFDCYNACNSSWNSAREEQLKKLKEIKGEEK